MAKITLHEEQTDKKEIINQKRKMRISSEEEKKKTKKRSSSSSGEGEKSLEKNMERKRKLSSSGGSMNKRQKLEQNLINSEKDLINSEKDLINSEKNLINSEKNLINGEKNLMNSKKSLISSEKKLMNSEKNLINSEKILINSEKDLMNSKKNLINGDKKKLSGSTNSKKVFKQNEEITNKICKETKKDGKLNISNGEADTKTVQKKSNKSKHKKDRKKSDNNKDKKASADPLVKDKKASADPLDKDANINGIYDNQRMKSLMSRTWSGSVAKDLILPNGGKVLQKPFPVCHLTDFLQNVPKQDKEQSSLKKINNTFHKKEEFLKIRKKFHKNEQDCCKVAPNAQEATIGNDTPLPPPVDLLHRVEAELQTLATVEKSNDMYRFRQSSNELPTHGACGELRDLLLGPVRAFVEQVTGCALNATLALSVSLYQRHDYLLCHDDELEGRRIAFILYLVEGGEWGPQDGGSLDLFSTRIQDGRPDAVVRSLYPRHNSFAFFEVSPVSFHQVAEVLTPCKTRLSVNGWFHGQDAQRPPRPLPPLRSFHPPGCVSLEDVYGCINPLYLAPALQASIRGQFTKDSQILLDEFLNPDLYARVMGDLDARRGGRHWAWAGPPNRAHYQMLLQDSYSSSSHPPTPSPLQQLVRVLRSEAMFVVLAQLTGLPLHPAAASATLSQESLNEEDDESDNEDGEDSDFSDEEEETSLSGEEVLVTVGDVIEAHRRGHGRSHPTTSADMLDLGQDQGSFGMDQHWIPDTGLLDQQYYGQASPSSTNEASPTTGTATATVFTSVRKITAGCYTLILDDDNKQMQVEQTPMLGGQGEEGTPTLEKSNRSLEEEDGPSVLKLNKETFNNKKRKVPKDNARFWRVQEVESNNAHDGRLSKERLNYLTINKTLKNKNKEDNGDDDKKNLYSTGPQEKENNIKERTPSEEDSIPPVGRYVLDAGLYCCRQGDDVEEGLWGEDRGGYTGYVAHGEAQEIITILPKANSLTLVYRDSLTFPFLKRVDSSVGKDSRYYQVCCQYLHQ